VSEGARSILLVEDNEDNRIVYATILRHHGYRVLEAFDGAEALAKVAVERPDLILLDISLPHIDGWEVSRRLRSNEPTRDIRIVALTAHAMPGDRERARLEGFDGYLAKPCEPRAVLSEVKRLLA
jgi:two-component system cell cycle response regulator DivK